MCSWLTFQFSSHHWDNSNRDANSLNTHTHAAACPIQSSRSESPSRIGPSGSRRALFVFSWLWVSRKPGCLQWKASHACSLQPAPPYATAARGAWADRDDAVRALYARGAVPRGLFVADDAAQCSCLLDNVMMLVELAELQQRMGPGVWWGVGRADRPRLRRRRHHRVGRVRIVH